MKRTFLFGTVLIFTIFGTTASIAATAAEDYQAGLADYKAGNWQQSAAELSQAVQLDPTQWQAYQLLGYDYCQEGRLSEGLDACQQSLSLNPNNPTLKAFVDNSLRPKVAGAEAANMPAAPGAAAGFTPFTLSNTSNEAAPPQNSFYVNLGGNYNDAETGDNLGLGYGWGISNTFSIVADLRIFYFAINDGSSDVLFNISALANAKFDFMDCHNPEVIYGIAGLGLAEWDVTGYSYNEMDVAYRLGLGLDIHLNPGFCLFLENDVEGTIGTGSGLNNRFGFFEIGLKMD